MFVFSHLFCSFILHCGKFFQIKKKVYFYDVSWKLNYSELSIFFNFYSVFPPWKVVVFGSGGSRQQYISRNVPAAVREQSLDLDLHPVLLYR